MTSSDPAVRKVRPVFPVCFVSCDIAGHTAERDIGVQRSRIDGINAIADAAVERRKPARTVWASGGDGGHLVFFDDARMEAAVDYICALHAWASKNKVQLRITGHVGDVLMTTGAKNNEQCVGAGINLAGRLLALGSPSGVLVSKIFRDHAQHIDGLEFTDPHVLFPRSESPIWAYLLSKRGQFKSRPSAPRGDQALLADAMVSGKAWRAVLHAKRLLQLNTQDEQAEDALYELEPHRLVYREAPGGEVPNPLFSGLDAGARLNIVLDAQLVKRERGEVLFEEGQPGDTMFIILDGAVAVIPKTSPDDPPPKPRHIALPGEILGELAPTLRRRRTATLITLEPASLLSLDAATLNAHAESAEAIGRFLTRRVVEFACNSLSCLVGRDRSGPLARNGRRLPIWDNIVADSRLIKCSASDTLSLSDARFRDDGLYLLVSGGLKSQSNPAKALSDSDLPIVFADLPGLCTPNHEYRPESNEALVLRIGAKALLQRKSVFDERAEARRMDLARLYHYDVFLSHRPEDGDVAERWRERLKADGLKVCMRKAVADAGQYSRDRIEFGILDSLVHVALISSNAARANENEVKHELDFRRAAFGPRTAQIVPVRLAGARPRPWARDGYPVIDATESEESAIAVVRDLVRQTRRGDALPPFADCRKTAIRLADAP